MCAACTTGMQMLIALSARRGGSLVLLGLILGAVPAAAATGDPPDPGSTQRCTYGSGSSAHPYIVYVPASYDAARPAPLVVMTHGCQTTAEQQMRANLYNQVAEREGIVMLYPDVDAMEAAQPGPTARCWQFPDPQSWHRDSGDAAAIAGMTRAVIGRWRIDPKRVYMVGMSAGSFMTSIMAAAYPDLYAAVAINAGGAYADAECLFVGPGIPVQESARLAYDEMGPRARIVPRLVMGGDSDQGVPPACADKALEQGLRTNNLVLGDQQDTPISLKPTWVREVPKPGGYSSTVSTYLDPNGCVIGERWLIHGMNHFWPGGSADPKWASWTDPKGPNGAEVSWRFLSRYTKSSTAMPCAEAPAAAMPVPATHCRARWLTLGLPAGAKAVRATVNGRRATIRVSHRRVRVRLSPTSRSRTTVVIRGRSGTGKRFTGRHTYRGCG
jgi:poly(hydroxyalkanoate) depolymerase family esterase